MDEKPDRLDRLYDLLPAIYRLADADQGYPLKAWLRVIAEQVNVVEDDIAQLYDNWFIETAQDWVLPYLGDLIGYRTAHEAGEPADMRLVDGRARSRILIPRRDVANTIGYRRRKGTLALLETLAHEVAGWPARAVEFYRLLGWTQNINHQHLERARTADLRNGDTLDLLDGPFDVMSHAGEVRRIDSRHTPGRHNIPTVGLFVWRLKPYSVTRTPAFCLEEVGPHCYTFSVLGNDAPLYIRPETEPEPTDIAEELNLPAPIRRRLFEEYPELFYGADKSVAVWAGGWAGHDDPQQPIPASKLIAADLSDWQYRPPRGHIAVDPVRGRIAFPPSQLPKKVRVTYHYAFSADIGGGAYDRPLSQPEICQVYRVGEDEAFKRITEALAQWQADLKQWPANEPQNAVIEITDNGVYVELIHIPLAAGQSLQLRAANGARPVIRLLDWHTDLPDSLTVTMARGSHFTLDGVLVTGRAVHFRGAQTPDTEDTAQACARSTIDIRHCTLTPGWGLHNDCSPRRPAEPSLELFNLPATVRIEHSILGPMQISEDQVLADPVPIAIFDSILDAMSSDREALGGPGRAVAHALLAIRRCTVLGIVDVHAIELAENCIFSGCLNVARRQLGCMRFCYVPPGCRTPRRYQCQPDLAVQAAAVEWHQGHPSATPSASELEAAQERARARVRPQFNSMRYGAPSYCQLADNCAEEIARGAADESEIGVFHDLYQPQRAANLRARLDEYVPAGMQAGIIYAS
jgi:hypothetical protein